MSFETGVSLSPSDLLNRLRIRLLADSWTLVRDDGGPGNDQLSMSDGSADQSTQFNFLADDTAATANISCQPSTGDGGAGVDFFNHTGSPNTAGTLNTYVHMGQRQSTTDQGFSGGHTKYFFFTGSTTSGRYCHVVVEGTSGVYWHMAFGTVEKAGAFSGGTYLSASSNTNLLNAAQFMFQFGFSTVAQNTHWFRNDDHYTSIGQTTDGGTSRWFEEVAFAGDVNVSSQLFAPLYQGGLQSFNQRTPFCPIWLHVFNSLTPSPVSTAYKICGHIPDARFVSMDGREPGETIVIGSDTWHIFPMHRKTTDGISVTSAAYINTHVAGSAPNNDSNLMGMAYREVA